MTSPPGYAKHLKWFMSFPKPSILYKINYLNPVMRINIKDKIPFIINVTKREHLATLLAPQNTNTKH